MTRFASRRDFLSLAGVALVTTQIPSSAKASAWTTASPAEADFAPDLDARFDALQASGRLKNLHGVVVLRDGAVAKHHDTMQALQPAGSVKRLEAGLKIGREARVGRGGRHPCGGCGGRRDLGRHQGGSGK